MKVKSRRVKVRLRPRRARIDVHGFSFFNSDIIVSRMKEKLKLIDRSKHKRITNEGKVENCPEENKGS